MPKEKEFAVTAAVTLDPPVGEQPAAPAAAPGPSPEELDALVSPLGDAYFVHLAPGQPPLVVEHATGLPRYRVEGGELVPTAPSAE